MASSTIIATILTSSVIGILINKIFDLMERRSSSNEDFHLLLLNAIKQQARAAIHDRYITIDDLESLEKTYERYKKRKGNGYADTLMKKVRALPVREDI